MEEFDDSDVEEIQLFNNANTASPSNRSPSESSTNAVPQSKKAGMFNPELGPKSLQRQTSGSPRERHAKGATQGSKGKSSDTCGVPESSNDLTSLKRLLEHETGSGKTLKRQRTLEELNAGGKGTDGNDSNGHGVSSIKQERENYENRTDQANAWNLEAKDSGIPLNISGISHQCPHKNMPSNMDCPPIAIVSPLSDQNPPKSDSPDDDMLKLDPKILSDEGFDSSLMDDLPCSLDEIVTNIFSDKLDTFQTLDGSSWTFPDLQNINIDEGQQTDSVTNETTDTAKLSDQNLQKSTDMSNPDQVVMKQEPKDHKDFPSDIQTKNDVLIQDSSSNKELLLKKESQDHIDLTNTNSPPIKSEASLMDCASQGQPFSDFLQRYSPSYTVPTERITPPKPDNYKKTGYDGLIQAGPPNRMIPDIVRQLKTRDNSRVNDLSPFPAIQSMLNNQNFGIRPMSPNQRSSGQPFHPGPATPNYHHPSMQQPRPPHQSSMMPRQPSLNQPSAMEYPGKQFQMPRPNSSLQYQRTMGGANSGYAPSFRNNAPVNLPQYNQNYRPQMIPNRHPGNVQWNSSGHFSQSNLNQNLYNPSLPMSSGSYNPRGHSHIPSHNGNPSPQGMLSSNMPSRNHIPGQKGMPCPIQGQHFTTYPRSVKSPNQPNVVGFQRPSPERLRSPSLSPGHSVHQPYHQPAIQQRLSPQVQVNHSQIIGNPGQSMSSSWNQNPNNPLGMAAHQNKPNDNSDFSYGADDAMSSPFSQPGLTDPSLPSIKGKLMAVIHLSKKSTSPNVKYMVSNFLQRVKHAKESRLSDAERYNFIEDTKKFIKDITIMMKSWDDQSQSSNANSYQDKMMPNTTYTNYNMPQANNNSANLTGFNGSENVTGFNNSTGVPQFQNQSGTSLHLVNPFMDDFQGREVSGIRGANPNYGSPPQLWNMGGNAATMIGSAVKQEPNPLEQFIS